VIHGLGSSTHAVHGNQRYVKLENPRSQGAPRTRPPHRLEPPGPSAWHRDVSGGAMPRGLTPEPVRARRGLIHRLHGVLWKC